MKLILHTFNLELKHPFTISRGTRTHVPSLIVELKDGPVSGYGEATANPYYETDVQTFVQKIQPWSAEIEQARHLTPEAFWEAMNRYFGSDLFLLCALDEAYHDLYCKRERVRLLDYWGLEPHPTLHSNYTLGIDRIEVMIEKMKQVDYPIYKIKLGTPNDLEIVGRLREHSDAVFRIDANCAWTAEETLQNATALKKLGVEFIEQPLPREDHEGAKILFEESVLPIIADESCITEEDVETCKGAFHGINIKLMKCGGLTPARRMLSRARQLGMQTMVGCMTESTVGISALAQLTPLLDYVDMDGAALLREDIATGVQLENGAIVFSDGYGTGAELVQRNPVV